MDRSGEQRQSNDEHLAMIIRTQRNSAVRCTVAVGPIRDSVPCIRSIPTPPLTPGGKVSKTARWSPEMPQLIPIWVAWSSLPRPHDEIAVARNF